MEIGLLGVIKNFVWLSVYWWWGVTLDYWSWRCGLLKSSNELRAWHWISRMEKMLMAVTSWGNCTSQGRHNKCWASVELITLLLRVRSKDFWSQKNSKKLNSFVVFTSFALHVGERYDVEWQSGLLFACVHQVFYTLRYLCSCSSVDASISSNTRSIIPSLLCSCSVSAVLIFFKHVFS